MYVRGKQLKILLYMEITTAENKEMMQIHTHVLKSLSASTIFFFYHKDSCAMQIVIIVDFLFSHPRAVSNTFFKSSVDKSNYLYYKYF